MPRLDFPKSSSLKAHKALPRRRILSGNTGQFEIVKDEQERLEQRDRHDNLSEHIHSWIPEPPVFQSSSKPRLPLTPPSLSKEHEVLRRTHDQNPKGNVLPSNSATQRSDVSTPLNQQSPPTPDMTPPGKPKNSAMLTSPPISRFPSSRAESFETAREQFSSDDENYLDESLKLQHPWKNRLHTARDSKVKEVGLGLGLESDNDDERTPKAQTPKAFPQVSEFVIFDGAWGSEREDTNEHMSSSDEPALTPNMTLRKKARNLLPRPIPSRIHDSATRHDNLDNSLRRGPSLRERIGKSRNSPPNASTERFAKQIDWPVSQDHFDIDRKLRQVDTRRLSQMSATSTVVSAMVVETPPQRRQTLRHTNKNPALRATSSPVSGSNRSSFVSSDTQHRLVHRNTRITDRSNRRSLTSDTSTSLSSNVARSPMEVSKVTRIPERRSSLKASTHGHLRHLSLGPTRQQSVRPSTAPDEENSFFEIPTSRRRPLSEVLPLSYTSKSEVRERNKVPPTIPTRSSSLSAPTSRNVSRTASLTSTSLQAHNAQHQLEINQPRPTLHVTEDQDAQGEDSHSSVVEDLAALRPQSTLVTPYSHTSVHSSTPGTLEVSEATAVSIYPHNNRSILVVQQKARADSQQRDQPTINEEVVSSSISDYSTPAKVHRPKQLVDSPLRNPREPPEPPAFTIIPPTPAVSTPIVDRDTSRERPTSIGTKNGPFAMVKRALSSRRYSESFVSPITQSLVRHKTVSNCSPTVVADSKLHPFWRPRGFWDDLSDSESDFGTDGFLVGDTLGVPQQRVVSRPSSLSRRFTSLKFRRRSSADAQGYPRIRRRKSSESTHSYEFIQPERKYANIMPRLGYQVQFVGFAGLRDGLEKRKVRKEEGRRERERARLRSSIGAVIVQPDARLV